MFLKIQNITLVGAIVILSLFTSCQKTPANNTKAENNVSSETSLSVNDEQTNMTELRGKSYRLYYDTEKWVDSSYLKDQLDGNNSASSTDVILEVKNAEGNFLMITDNDVGQKGKFKADDIGAQYEAAASADEKIRFLGCKDIEVNGHKGVCVTVQPNDDSMMEMWYFWHDTYQTMFAVNTSKEAYEELYPDFMQVINSVELD